MKSIIFSYLLVLSFAVYNVVNAAGAASFSGVNPGRSFKDIKNHNPLITQRYSADPGVMVYDGRVYVYATNDGDTSVRYNNENKYDQINTINCMSSSDLVNWVDHGSIPAAGGGGAAKWAKNSWAPTAAHKKIDGKEKFFLYFADSGNGIGVLTADSPTGPFKDPIGRALINRQTPNCANVTWLFDPAVFVDDDGTGYIYFGGGVPTGQSASPKTGRVAKLGNDMTSIVGTPSTLDAPWLFEDSGIHKMGNTYYYSYCTNWDNGPYGNARIAYMTSSNPMGPFQFQGTCFNNPGDFFQTTGNNHHTIIEFKDKYYIFYHAEWLNKQVLGNPKGYRTTHCDELPINGNKLGNAKGTLNGVAQLGNVDGSAVNPAAMMAWQSGISIKTLAAVPPVNYGRGAWTGVSNVDLGDAKSITLKASSQSGATVKIAAGSPDGTVLGYVEVPGGSAKEVTGELTGASGVKNLFFIASGDVTIETWQLDGKSAASTGNTGNTGGNTENTGNTGGSTVSTETRTEVSEITDGWYYIKNTGSDLYLTAEGKNAEIQTFAESDAQKWKVTLTDGGYFTLTNGLGTNLDITDGKDDDMVNVGVYEAYGGEAQQFKVKSNGGNSFAITSRVSGGTRAIDVYNFGTTDGSNVHQYSLNDKPNQDWVFEAIGGKTASPSGGNSGSCWAEKLGYPCCKSCGPVYYTDSDGKWGVENDNWCGINCSSNNSSKCTGAQGFPCCAKSCDVYFVDKDGEWGIEGDWCLIDPAVCA